MFRLLNKHLQAIRVRRFLHFVDAHFKQWAALNASSL